MPNEIATITKYAVDKIDDCFHAGKKSGFEEIDLNSKDFKEYLEKGKAKDLFGI